MGTISDAFGIWNDLGTILPTINNWTKFTNTAVGGLNTIRASFIVDTSKELNSFCWLRWSYIAEGQNLTTRATKIYPRNETLLLDVPIPDDLKVRDIFYRDFEVKKFVYGSKFSIKDQLWQIKLEELWG